MEVINSTCTMTFCSKILNQWGKGRSARLQQKLIKANSSKSACSIPRLQTCTTIMLLTLIAAQARKGIHLRILRETILPWNTQAIMLLKVSSQVRTWASEATKAKRKRFRSYCRRQRILHLHTKKWTLTNHFRRLKIARNPKTSKTNSTTKWTQSK